jgi:diguanylate cyclase (GGDEF)-like protein
LRAAQTDALTGISNRAHLFELLEQQISKRQAVRQPCGVALLDLDHFKRINDTYGHQAGDAVLKDFATSMQKILRREDGFGRVGGEEFMLVLPGIGAAELSLLMPRVLGVVRASRPLPGQPDFFYTSSAGVTLLVDGDDARSVYHRVDEALYAAKHGGRDRYAWAH